MQNIRISCIERLRQKHAVLRANEAFPRVFGSGTGRVDEALALTVPSENALRRHHCRHFVAEEVERRGRRDARERGGAEGPTAAALRADLVTKRQSNCKSRASLKFHVNINIINKSHAIMSDM